MYDQHSKNVEITKHFSKYSTERNCIAQIQCYKTWKFVRIILETNVRKIWNIFEENKNLSMFQVMHQTIISSEVTKINYLLMNYQNDNRISTWYSNFCNKIHS